MSKGIFSFKRGFAALFFGLLVSMGAAAQGSAASEAVKAQAQKMATALSTGDYKTFVHYNNPAVKKLAGGDEGLLKVLQQMDANFKNVGMSFEKITIGNPSPVMKSAAEWQCVVPQETVIKTKDGKFLTKSMLIAVSSDGGKTWTFVDTSNKDMDTIRKLLPNLNPNIVIPPTPKPQRLPG